MDAPWIAWPDLPAGDIGWRMGEAESYYDEFYQWFSRIPASDQATFEEAHPPPMGWAHLYSMIRSNPWLDNS